MSDLFEDGPSGNSPEYTVSELSGAVKRVIEGEFGLVRVRGEIGRVSRPASGHMYFDLKDDRSVVAAISWKGQVSKMQVKPEEGMEVIATGRMTTFPGQSKYQLIVESVVPAGAGALMAMLEARRKALAAEGLFDAGRKRPLPYLPAVIGVVTSPSGAVIRDILHRLRDRFARHVLIWPVAVQGQACAPEVAAAIKGFNAIAPGGPIPRPDLIIVARGGGSLEDLWGFNEEIVVRAAAESQIPLISAVGHETDTTLIDHASDRRAPTPTAAAEIAVPVRMELIAALDGQTARLTRAVAQGLGRRGERLRDLGRALPRIETLTQGPAQRFDLWGGRLGGALTLATGAKRAGLDRIAAPMRPRLLLDMVARRRDRLEERHRALGQSHARRMERAAERLASQSERLQSSITNAFSKAGRDIAKDRTRLTSLEARLHAAPGLQLGALSKRLDALDRTRQTLGYGETLRRGYAVVRGEDGVVTSRADAAKAGALEVEFHDGRLPVGAAAKPVKAKPRPPKSGGKQGSLF
ncbi:exodeoxyribonuclease VII large subunit [Pseudorhodobacter aquimaris]|uniref:exodeoxyribonuclease VII large subunit n=1 Tax=Pseudorhodobacter aquimaris TaxID=687412 RepID=UPI00067ADE2D|nr:exodeoxyribonuclease VII large subunit [Pseudorhodobacter aquimaris]